MKKANIIKVQDTAVRMQVVDGQDYINITDIAKSENIKRPGESIRSWMRRRDTMNFLRYWEEKHNPNLNSGHLATFWEEVGENRFQISPKEWIELSNAKGMINKAGRNGGTFAHVNIAIHYANWVNFKFYLHFIEDYARLKKQEASLMLKAWDFRRELVKASYEVHTEAIRTHLVPVLDWHTEREKPLFATEADLLNQAVFGMTAREFKQLQSDFKGNLRDWASEAQLKVLDAMQSVNAAFIEAGLTQEERYAILWQRAQKELEIYKNSKAFNRLKEAEKKLFDDKHF